MCIMHDHARGMKAWRALYRMRRRYPLDVGGSNIFFLVLVPSWVPEVSEKIGGARGSRRCAEDGVPHPLHT